MLPHTHAQSKIEIIPSLSDEQIEKLGDVQDRIMTGDEKSVWTKYNTEAKKLSTEEQFVSGVMTWDTIFDYAIIFLKFLSEAGIAIGGLQIIRVGYQYIMSVINGENPHQNLIKQAIIGILVIIFSYAIMRILTRTFLV